MDKGKINVSLDFSDLYNRIESLQNDINLLKDKVNTDNDAWGTYTTEDLVELFGVTKQTISEYVKKGILVPIKKTGKRNLFRKKDIHKILSK